MGDRDRMIELLKDAHREVQKEFAAARNLILRGKEVPWLKRNMYEIEADILLENGVRPVTLCQDCKERYKYSEFYRNTGEMVDCYGCHKHGDDFGEDGYCSYGESREGSEVE